MPLTVAEFVIRWKTHDRSEEAGAKPHFLDLCDLLGQPHPAAADSAGETMPSKSASAKPRSRSTRRRLVPRSLCLGTQEEAQAYTQLNDYREELGNPQLFVVCDFERFEVHTKFARTNKRVYKFNLDDLNRNLPTAGPLPPLDVLRASSSILTFSQESSLTIHVT